MCCCGDEESAKQAKLEFVETGRSCTDVLMFILFLIAGAASIAILAEAIKYDGNPYRTIYGVDFQGNVCGRSDGFKDLKYAAWPVPPTSTSIDSNIYYRIKICVASCDETFDPSSPRADYFTQTDTTYIGYESFKFFRYCIPKINASGKFESAAENASRTISDLLTTWPVILVAGFVALLLSFVYVKLMKVKCIRKTLVWGVICLTIVGGFLAGWGLLKFADSTTSSEVDMFDRALAAKILGWIVIGVTAIYLLVVFFLRKRINLALAVLGATAAAVDQMKSIILYPLFPFFCTLAYLAYWIATMVVMFSVKDEYTLPLPDVYSDIQAFAANSFTTYQGYAWNDKFQYLAIYQFFHLLWTYQFIIYATFMTFAGAIAEWYFSFPDPNNPDERIVGVAENHLSSTPVFNSMIRVIRYHLGTVAFGALIIAIIEMIRAVVTYIQRKTRNSESRAVKCLLCCVQCCLACVQKCVDYVSRNALIWCAIKGDDFCTSACGAFGLILSNLGRAAALQVVSTFVIFFGKICVALLCTGGAGVAIYYIYDDDVFSTVVPMVVIFIVTFVIATLFMDVFSVAMDTMFVCYLADVDGKFTPGALNSALEEAQAKALENQQDGTKTVAPATNEPVYVQTQQGQPQQQYMQPQQQQYQQPQQQYMQPQQQYQQPQQQYMQPQQPQQGYYQPGQQQQPG